MLAKIPQVGAQYNLGDLFSGFGSFFGDQEKRFAAELSKYLPSRWVCFANSGLSAFYLILNALKKSSSRKEVVLPAYTAPSLIVAVLKAGLKPILCDISLTDFNMDLKLLPQVITDQTLCVVPVHMFGIPVKNIEGVKQTIPGITVIEDCAQSFGSKINGKNTGVFSDISFTTFNRGKNLSTYGGGAVFTDSEEMSKQILQEINTLAPQSPIFQIILPIKMAAITFALKPLIYGALFSAIAQFKDNAVPKDFEILKYSGFQAGVGMSLLSKIDGSSEKRRRNGEALINSLAGIEGLIVPSVSKKCRPAFNRLPIVFKDIAAREKIEKALWRSGVDTSRMYLRPLHHIFNLGYRKEDFPKAVYFAQGLLTLPAHPFIKSRDVEMMIKVVKEEGV